jgi:hypothetical protein
MLEQVDIKLGYPLHLLDERLIGILGKFGLQDIACSGDCRLVSLVQKSVPSWIAFLVKSTCAVAIV